MKNARVTYSHKRPPYWEVTASDGRWWSVAYNQDTYRYLITNRTGRVVDQHGPTGQKVLDVVHDHMRGTSGLRSGLGTDRQEKPQP